jgi:hypothetical protein
MAPISSNLKNKLLTAPKRAPTPAPTTPKKIAKPAASAQQAVRTAAPAPKTTAKAPAVAQSAARELSRYQPPPTRVAPVSLNAASRAERAISSNLEPVRAADAIRRGSAAFEAPALSAGASVGAQVSSRRLELSRSLGVGGGFVPAGSDLARRLDTTRSPGVGGGFVPEGALDSITGKGKVAAALVSDEARAKLLKGAAQLGLGDKLGLGGAAGPKLHSITADAAERAAEAERAEAARTTAERAQAVEDAYESGGAQAAAEELDRQTEALGDNQAAVDELLEEVQPTLDKIAEDVVQDEGEGVQQRTEATVNALSRVADRASDAGVERITRPLAEALPNQWPGASYGPVPANSINVLASLEGLAAEGKGTRISLSLGAQLDAAGKDTAREVNAAGFNALNVVETQYTEARQAREAADAELAAQLAELDGVLSPEERQAYIDEYHERHKDVYEGEAAAAEKLNAQVAPNVDLIDEAVVRDPARAGEVVEVMTALASSPLPAAATEWGVNAFQDGSDTAALYAPHRDDIRTNVVEKGLAGTLTQYQTEAGGDAHAAAAKFDQLFKGMKAARGLFGNAQQYRDFVEEGGKFVSAVWSAARGDSSKLRELLEDPRALKGLTPTGAAFGAAGLAFGLVNAANAEDAQKLAVAAGQAGRAGLELYAQAVGSLTNSGRLALLVGTDAAQTAASGARFLTEKLIPGLSLGVNAIATVDAFQKALNDPSLGNVVSVVGNAISVIGSAISLFPPLAVVGKVVEAVGAAVTWLGGVVSGNPAEEARNNEQQHILEELWKDDPYFQAHPEQLGTVAGRIADNDSQYDDVQRAGGLSREQLFELIYRAGPDPTSSLLDLTQVAAATGLQGDALIAAIDDLANREGGLQNAYLQVEQQLYSLVTHPPANEAERLSRLQGIAHALGIEGPDSPNN